MTSGTIFVYAEGKVVRVGWYDSQFNYSDRFGRRSGYAYEYQQKIAAYTGWTYEYVEASWPDLFDMLKKGEIYLLSDVSYTKEREGTSPRRASAPSHAGALVNSSP